MSNTHLFLIPAIVSAPLKNGVGRYVGQLQRVTLKFCKNRGDSRGVRDFIERYLVDYAKNNPGVVVYVKPRRHRPPVLVSEFLNGERHELNCRDFDGFQVGQFLNLYTKICGRQESRLTNSLYTSHPSIQGPWTPWTNRDPEMAVADLMNDKKWREKANLTPTATDLVLEMFKQQQMDSQHQLEEKEAQ
ncbi:large ribosomal subunit protein mL43 [Neocloeon triangulifer]|uniref:large ribosomal subunit protein mL43 n=1 Tax=Neocloeon triangulifer TaxID=2078957 RepID=UPI00286F781B|nr:large ribosomal subunit protein mL43 [Neocloeon triangulifer]